MLFPVLYTVVIHSLELTWEVEHGPLEDHFPLQTGCFPLPCQFQGVYLFQFGRKGSFEMVNEQWHNRHRAQWSYPFVVPTPRGFTPGLQMPIGTNE